MGSTLNELRDLKEMYETRLKSDNTDKTLKDHYQTMLDSINEKIEKNQETIKITKIDEKIEKVEGLPKIMLLSTGGTIASNIDYRTGAVTPVLTAE